MAEEKNTEEKNTEEKNTEEKKKPKGGFLKLIIIAVLVIILGTGGFLGWSKFIKKDKNKNQVQESNSQEEVTKEAGTYELDTFIVNLLSKSGSGKRYLKTGMILEINDKLQSDLLDKSKPQIRDSVLILLSNKTFKEVGSMEGKIELKQSLMMRINQIVGEAIVNNIYFTEFVVQ